MGEGDIHVGHRQRLKRRFAQQGSLEGFAPHEVLELLLYYAIPQGDTNPLAHRLIEQFGSLQEVRAASPEALAQVKGVGEHTAILLTLTNYIGGLIREETPPQLWVRNRAEAVTAARKFMGDTAEERILLLMMDCRGRLLRAPTVAAGTACSVDLPIPRITEWAVRLRPQSLILVHNHPEGAAEPSSQDDRGTRQLLLAMHFQNVTVADHLILGRTDAYSYAGEGRLEQLHRDVLIRIGQLSAPPG